MAQPRMQNMWANSTIGCSVILIPDATHFNSVKKAPSGAVLPSGISPNGARTRPDPDFAQSTQAQQIAAIAGETVDVYGPGCTGIDLVCGTVPWAAGDLIMADSNGYGITCTTGNYYVGRAQTTGVAGALCPVDVNPGYMGA